MSSVEEFRTEIRGRPAARPAGAHADPGGRGGPGREHEAFAERIARGRHTAAGRTCAGRPEKFGGRGAALGRQTAFRRGPRTLVGLAVRDGAAEDPPARDRPARARTGLETIRRNAPRTLDDVAAGAPGPEASIGKTFWSTGHRERREPAMGVRRDDGTPTAAEPHELDGRQRLFLFSRSDTIHAGSNEIPRDSIAERVLGLPGEARP
ncbi:acyl-CoA dehydrogenase family protein [Streptomyces sp. NPDC014734]|uniref:acyl-CoA dehydrogenase family protein n=1 Tax=Streptomyces sp. NPDC014734 TaxID=3364886 RepID=UPI0036FB83D6